MRSPTLNDLPTAGRAWTNGAQTTRVTGSFSGQPVFRIARTGDRGGSQVMFCKLTWTSDYPGLAPEAERLAWARKAGAPVPELLDFTVGDEVAWLVTRGVDGTDARQIEHLDHPERTVALLATALREWHDTLDITTCPFQEFRDVTLRTVDAALLRGAIDLERCHDWTKDRFATPEQAVQRLHELERMEPDLVVTHGDWCFPNVILDNHAVTGVIDVGALGVADRWRDLAVATWSTVWNLGAGYEELFLDTYGAEWDDARMEFYRLAYDLHPG